MIALALALPCSFGAPMIAAAQPVEHPASHGEGHHEDPTKSFNFFDGIPFGYKKLDKQGGPIGDGKLGDEPLPAGAAEEPMSPPFALMVLNFAIVLVILAKYGAPAARKIAETRSDQIKSALDEAARLRDEAKAKLEEYGARLAAADAEMTTMIERVRADAEADRVRVIAAAEAQATALKKDAEDRIAAEIELARYALAKEVATASAAAATTLLEETTTGADHTRLVDSFITDVGGGAARRPEGRS